MNTPMNTLADMTALYFAGKTKTAQELRLVVLALRDNLKAFQHLSNDQCEFIARDNEAKQGIRMGLSEIG